MIEVVGQEDASSGSTINSFSRIDVISHYRLRLAKKLSKKRAAPCGAAHHLPMASDVQVVHVT